MNCGQTDPSQHAETPSFRKFSDMTQILPEKRIRQQATRIMGCLVVFCVSYSTN